MIKKKKTKPIRDPGRVTAAKIFSDHNRKVREEKKKRGGSKQP